MNNRRKLIIALGAGALTGPLMSLAQPAGKVARIGYLAILSNIGRLNAFRQGLAELGYVEGKNIIVERRSAEGKAENLPGLAAELVGLKPDVLVALDPPSFEAARGVTRTVPIVMRISVDPVATRIVTSLAHPGGNITGIFSLNSELNGKRLELLKEAFPSASRVMLLWNPSWQGEQDRLRVAVDSTRKLGLHPLPSPVNKADEIENAFKAAARDRASGLLVLRSPFMVANMAQIVKLAAKERLPAIYDEASYVEKGGLMSYGANLRAIDHHAASFVDKILKGAKPGDLPVEQPTIFELIINVKVAKTLGIKIAQSILLRADKVIE